ncbi:MAG: sigma-70 family RNA polymerase sigma factor [Deltaproteobacteria bacterium]|nr:sigma-70 family RNA polymerase sigma factor [Deltaproteobacteria bacterium]
MLEARENSKITLLKTHKYSPYDYVNGLITGDRDICAAFFDRYHKQINGLVHKFLGPDQEHEDLVNTVFLNILSYASKIRDPQALQSLISTITIKTVQKEIRKRQYRRKRVLFSDMPLENSIHNESHDNPIDNDAFTKKIFRILYTFPPDEHVHFVMHYLEGYTFEEISQITGCSLSTAKRKGKSCKKRFMENLDKDETLLHFLKER